MSMHGIVFDSTCFYLKARNDGMERLEYQEFLLKAAACDLFECKEVEAIMPVQARIFPSVTCEKCGEATAENKIRLQEGKQVCMDCFQDYTRGW